MKKRIFIYQHPIDKKIKAVKEGLSYPAFFFNIIWMMVNDLWNVIMWWTVAMLINFLVFVYFIDFFPLLNIVVFFLLVFVIPLFFGNKWITSKLKKKGFVLLEKDQLDTLIDVKIARRLGIGLPSYNPAMFITIIAILLKVISMRVFAFIIDQIHRTDKGFFNMMEDLQTVANFQGIFDIIILLVLIFAIYEAVNIWRKRKLTTDTEIEKELELLIKNYNSKS